MPLETICELTDKWLLSPSNEEPAMLPISLDPKPPSGLELSSFLNTHRFKRLSLK